MFGSSLAIAVEAAIEDEMFGATSEDDILGEDAEATEGRIDPKEENNLYGPSAHGKYNLRLPS